MVEVRIKEDGSIRGEDGAVFFWEAEAERRADAPCLSAGFCALQKRKVCLPHHTWQGGGGSRKAGAGGAAALWP